MRSCVHLDCGCSEGSDCCLDCPLAACIHETAGRAEQTEQNRQQTLAMVTSGMSVTNVAAVLGISRYTVYDRLRRVRTA